MLIQSLANAAKIVTEARKYTLLLETQERNFVNSAYRNKNT